MSSQIAKYGKVVFRGEPLYTGTSILRLHAYGTDGKILLRWPIQRFVQLCGGDEELGTLLYQELRSRIRAADSGKDSA